MMDTQFTVGQQPCQNFTPREYGSWGGMLTHECYCGHKKGLDCTKSVAMCSNCMKDHHEGGYESCVCGGKGFIA